MPKLKEPSRLQVLCLKSIVKNLDSHALAHYITKSEVTFYSPLQRLFSDDLLEIAFKSEPEISIDRVRFTELQLLCIGIKLNDNRSRRSLEFLFNPYLKTVFPSFGDRRCFNSLPANLLQKLFHNCKNITSLDLSNFLAVEDKIFLPVVTHSLRNVTRLIVSYTRVGDESLLAVMLYCPLLTHLDFNCTLITHEGIKMLCGNYLHSMENGRGFYGWCKNSTNCSVKPKLKYFNINRSAVTTVGIICILQHFPSLEILKYEIRKHLFPGARSVYFFSTPGSIPEALVLLQKQVRTYSYKVNLEELTFFDVKEVSKNLEKALLLCPRLKTFKSLVTLDSQQYFQVANCEYLTDVTLCIRRPGTVKSTGFQSFLVSRGHKLTSLTLNECIFYGTSSLFIILSHCRNLHELHFTGLILMPPRDNVDVKEFKNNASLEKLETFTISHLRGVKTLLSDLLGSIITISPNLQNLSVTDSKVDDNTFAAVQTCKALHNLRVLVFNCCNITQGLLWRLIQRDNELTMLRIFHCSLIDHNILKRMRNYVKEKNLSIDISDKFRLSLI